MTTNTVTVSVHWDGTVRGMVQLKKEHGIKPLDRYQGQYVISKVEVGSCNLKQCFHRILHLVPLTSSNKDTIVSWMPQKTAVLK